MQDGEKQRRLSSDHTGEEMARLMLAKKVSAVVHNELTEAAVSVVLFNIGFVVCISYTTGAPRSRAACHRTGLSSYY
ncbi:MAG: hypothetical protein CME32_25870 [Gimesia sp.]|nr:hypothetical protein [Gimesia sp.]